MAASTLLVIILFCISTLPKKSLIRLLCEGSRSLVLEIRVPFRVPLSKGAVLFWEPKKGPFFRELPTCTLVRGMLQSNRELSELAKK